MNSSDRPDRSDRKSSDSNNDASKSRKPRMAKKGWKPPAFDAFAESDRSKRRGPSDRRTGGGRPTSDRPSSGRPSSGGPDRRPASGRPTADGSDRRSSFGRGPSEGSSERRSYGGGSSDGPSERRSSPSRPPSDRPSSGRPSSGRPGSSRPATDRPYSDKPRGDRPAYGAKRPFKRDEAGGSDRPAFPKRSFNRDDKEGSDDRKPFNRGGAPRTADSDRKPFNRGGSGDRKPFGRGPARGPSFGPKRPFRRDDGEGSPPPRKFGRGGVPTTEEGSTFPAGPRNSSGFDKPSERPPRRDSSDRPPKRNFGDRPPRRDSSDRPPRRDFGDRPASRDSSDRPPRRDVGDRPARSGYGASKPGVRKPYDRTGGSSSDGDRRSDRKPARSTFRGFGSARKSRDEVSDVQHETPGLVRLNKYLSHSGVCARREADDMIAAGKVMVNGKVVSELGSKVMTTDVVIVDGMTIRFEPFKYILMHKPKNTITTTSDEKGRKTVMDIIETEIGERLYPVGRLDRNTTGVLLLTNDGDLTNRLTHPSYSVGKVYQAEVSRALNDAELDKLREGIELEDGPAKAYNVVRGLLDPYSIELAVHEGRNHLVKRMFEALGAEVVTLRRSQFAGLGLDDLRPGRWRFLKTKEINTLRTKVKLPELKKTAKQ